MQSIKVISIFIVCLLFRLLPWRPPNVELILSSQMPVAKTYGSLAGFLFGALSILAFDLLSGTVGLWTLVTAPTYGLLGLGAARYFRTRSKRRHYVYFAVAGTLFYDAVTGLSIGPLFFGQPFLAAAVGQIPFTLMHLLGNVSFAALWSTFLAGFLQPKPAQASLSSLLAPSVTR